MHCEITFWPVVKSEMPKKISTLDTLQACLSIIRKRCVCNLDIPFSRECDCCSKSSIVDDIYIISNTKNFLSVKKRKNFIKVPYMYEK